MNKNIYIIQSIWLLLGTIFAFSNVYTDFTRFYNMYGNITRLKDCIIPNPITTPCFYGALAFFSAFIWSVVILKVSKTRIITNQNKLHILLIGSNIFAFGNLSFEIYRFYFSKSLSQISCSGVPSANIYTTPCFIGSMFFLGSLIISTIIRTKNNSR